MPRAFSCEVVARRFEDLVAWQLCYQLKERVSEFTSRPAVGRQPELCRQIRRSSRSSAALIAEGFGRFRPKDFARFLEMAIGSLDETRNHLRDAADCRCITVEEFKALWHLSYRARRACSSLHAYLRTCKSPKQ